MLSIIVPVYNVEKYLNRCVESLLGQSYRELEVLLIDDGSTDNSPSICDQWAERDSRVRVFHQPNSGPSTARNFGLKEVKGSWITFVDSDDFLYPQCYEKMFGILQQSPSCDIGMFGFSCETEQGTILYESKFEQNKVFFIDDIINHIVLPLNTAIWNKVFRRQLLENIRFSEEYRHNEDLLFIVEALRENTTLISCDYLGYHYIKRENSLTSQAFNKHSIDEIECKDKSCEIIQRKFPRFSDKASVWGFIARLNVYRKIIHVKNDECVCLKKSYLKWMREYFSHNSHLLTKKHKIIFILINYHLACLLSVLKYFR